jgi:hypothetical protein
VVKINYFCQKWSKSTIFAKSGQNRLFLPKVIKIVIKSLSKHFPHVTLHASFNRAVASSACDDVVGHGEGHVKGPRRRQPLRQRDPVGRRSRQVEQLGSV